MKVKLKDMLYEDLKRKLKDKHLTPEEYEAEIKKITKALGL